MVSADDFFKKVMKDHGFNKNELKKTNTYRKLNWMQEKKTPELLPFQFELVENIIDGIKEQQQLISLNENLNEDEAFASSLMETEIQRLKYDLLQYFTVRRMKIEQYWQRWENPENCSQLAQFEKEYAADYAAIVRECIEDGGMSELTPDMKHMKAKNQFKVDASGIVCAHVLSDEPVDLGHEIQGVKGDLFFLEWKNVAALVQTGKVELF